MGETNLDAMLPSQSQTQQSPGQLKRTTALNQSVTLPWLTEPLEPNPRKYKGSAQSTSNKLVEQGVPDLFDETDEEDCPEYPDFTTLKCKTEMPETISAPNKTIQSHCNNDGSDNTVIERTGIQPSSNSEKCASSNTKQSTEVVPVGHTTSDNSGEFLHAPSMTQPVPRSASHKDEIEETHEPVAKKPCHEFNTASADGNTGEQSNVLIRPTPMHPISRFLQFVPEGPSVSQTVPNTCPNPLAENLFQMTPSSTSAFFPFSKPPTINRSIVRK